MAYNMKRACLLRAMDDKVSKIKNAHGDLRNVVKSLGFAVFSRSWRLEHRQIRPRNLTVDQNPSKPLSKP